MSYFGRCLVGVLITIVVTCSAIGQTNSNALASPYKINRKIEIPATVVGFSAIVLSGGWLTERSTLDESEVLSYDKDNVNAFDSRAFRFSESGYDLAGTLSDQGLNVTAAAPLLLLLDKRMRKDWLDLVILYSETQMCQSLIYYGTALSVRRARPLVYNENLTVGQRSGGRTTNSFFSGHTSTTATASFFMAKVYSDYHNPSRLNKILLYTAAAIPPAFVGFNRIKAGKHFPTDVLTGTIIGAAAGILIPEFHKVKPTGLSMLPVYNREFKGLAMRLVF